MWVALGWESCPSVVTRTGRKPTVARTEQKKALAAPMSRYSLDMALIRFLKRDLKLSLQFVRALTLYGDIYRLGHLQSRS